MPFAPDFIANNLPLAFGFFFGVVFCRAQGTYWLGRAAAMGALSGKDSTGIRGVVGRWFNGPVPRKGIQILDRWGLIIIPLCFLTVGIQTAVNAAAGLVNMRWVKYTLLMIPGCVAWALLYALGVAALWFAAFTAVAGNVYAWLALSILIVLIAGGVFLYRQHHKVLEEPLDA